MPKKSTKPKKRPSILDEVDFIENQLWMLENDASDRSSIVKGLKAHLKKYDWTGASKLKKRVESAIDSASSWTPPKRKVVKTIKTTKPKKVVRSTEKPGVPLLKAIEIREAIASLEDPETDEVGEVRDALKRYLEQYDWSRYQKLQGEVREALLSFPSPTRVVEFEDFPRVEFEEEESPRELFIEKTRVADDPVLLDGIELYLGEIAEGSSQSNALKKSLARDLENYDWQGAEEVRDRVKKVLEERTLKEVVAKKERSPTKEVVSIKKLKYLVVNVGDIFAIEEGIFEIKNGIMDRLGVEKSNVLYLDDGDGKASYYQTETSAIKTMQRSVEKLNIGASIAFQCNNISEAFIIMGVLIQQNHCFSFESLQELVVISKDTLVARFETDRCFREEFDFS